MTRTELLKVAEYHRQQAKRFTADVARFHNAQLHLLVEGARASAAWHEQTATDLTELAEAFTTFNHILIQP